MNVSIPADSKELCWDRIDALIASLVFNLQSKLSSLGNRKKMWSLKLKGNFYGHSMLFS